MRVAVLTATKRPGGLDVVYNSLVRQTFPRHDILWIVADELYHERQHIFREEVIHFPSYHFQPDRTPGYFSNLPGIYNQMFGIAISQGCELAVSLQDYIWAPAEGVKDFVLVHESSPRSLITGLCSMLAEPSAMSVVNPDGLWTVFEDDYHGPRPDALVAWRDVRIDMNPPFVAQCNAQHWEMNWAAIPLSVTMPTFDVKYGEHIGHENQQFAQDWHREGGHTLIDTSNHAYSLPHRYYFAEEWDEQQAHRAANHELYNSEFPGA